MAEQVVNTNVDKPPYRPLNIKERDMLFAFYDKHNGNMLAMSRDPECTFKAYSQIRYYGKLYNFDSQLTEIKRKRAEDIVARLGESKLQAIQRAIEMVQVKIVPVRNKQGDFVLGVDGQPIFVEMPPYYKEVKAAWEIIKTELGEPTSIMKSEIENPQATEVNKALDVIAQLAHAKSQTDGDPVSGKRTAVGDPAPVPPAVRDDIQKGAPAE